MAPEAHLWQDLYYFMLPDGSSPEGYSSLLEQEAPDHGTPSCGISLVCPEISIPETLKPYTRLA